MFRFRREKQAASPAKTLNQYTLDGAAGDQKGDERIFFAWQHFAEQHRKDNHNPDAFRSDLNAVVTGFH